MTRSTAATQRDAVPLELLADRTPMNAQLDTNLAQGPTLGVQVGRTLNVHCATVTSLGAAALVRPLTRLPSGRRNATIRPVHLGWVGDAPGRPG